MKWVVEKHGFDEIFDKTGSPRQHYKALISVLRGFTPSEIARRERLRKLSLMNQGITFTVYGEKEGIERIFPFDFFGFLSRVARLAEGPERVMKPRAGRQASDRPRGLGDRRAHVW